MSDPFEGKDVKFKFGDKEVDPSTLKKPHHAVVPQPTRATPEASTPDNADTVNPERPESDKPKSREDALGAAEHIVSPDWLGRPHFAMPDLRRPENFNTNSSGLLFGGDHRPKKQ